MTDRVEFKMNIRESDAYRAELKYFFMKPTARLFFGFCLTGLILLIVLFPLYRNTWFVYSAPVITIVLLVLLRVPFAVRRIYIQKLIATLNKLHNLTYSVDREKFCIKSDEMSYSAQWTLFGTIKEDKKYIFLCYATQNERCSVIYKYLLPAETVDAIKNILKQAPVKYITTK